MAHFLPSLMLRPVGDQHAYGSGRGPDHGGGEEHRVLPWLRGRLQDNHWRQPRRSFSQVLPAD